MKGVDLSSAKPFYKLNNLLIILSFLSIGCFGGSANNSYQEDNSLQYYDQDQLSFIGNNFSEQRGFPLKRIDEVRFKTLTPKLQTYSNHTTGLSLEFSTNSDVIEFYWKVQNSNPFPHMTDVAVRGLDYYIKKDSEWRHAGIGKPIVGENFGKSVLENLGNFEKEFKVFLPLFSDISEFKLGVKLESSFDVLKTKDAERPIIFYGTSMTHGACASRPGLAFPNIVGRKLNREIFNLGFSGEGKFEPVFADFISNLDASAILIEPLGNIDENLILEKGKRFVQTIRTNQPGVPIIFLDIPFVASELIDEKSNQLSIRKSKKLKALYSELVEKGDKSLFYIEKEQICNHSDNISMDALHPNDIGMGQIAKVVSEKLISILEPSIIQSKFSVK